MSSRPYREEEQEHEKEIRQNANKYKYIGFIRRDDLRRYEHSLEDRDMSKRFIPDEDGRNFIRDTLQIQPGNEYTYIRDTDRNGFAGYKFYQVLNNK